MQMDGLHFTGQHFAAGEYLENSFLIHLEKKFPSTVLFNFFFSSSLVIGKDAICDLLKQSQTKSVFGNVSTLSVGNF